MVYEVEFVNDVHEVMLTAFIYASTVTECRNEAKSLLKEKLLSPSYHIYIMECELYA